MIGWCGTCLTLSQDGSRALTWKSCGLWHGQIFFDASLASEPTPLDKLSRQNDIYVAAAVNIY